MVPFFILSGISFHILAPLKAIGFCVKLNSYPEGRFQKQLILFDTNEPFQLVYEIPQLFQEKCCFGFYT